MIKTKYNPRKIGRLRTKLRTSLLSEMHQLKRSLKLVDPLRDLLSPERLESEVVTDRVPQPLPTMTSPTSTRPMGPRRRRRDWTTSLDKKTQSSRIVETSTRSKKTSLSRRLKNSMRMASKL